MDLKEIPASIMDRVIKRQPMAIHHIRKKLTMQSIPRTVSDVTQSVQDVVPAQDNISVQFEDTVPFQHYTINSTELLDHDSSMYPWATDKKTVAMKKKLGRKQENDKLLLGTADSLSNNSLKTPPADHHHQDKSESVETLLPPSVVEDNSSSNDDPNVAVKFPSFSDWTKTQ